MRGTQNTWCGLEYMLRQIIIIKKAPGL
jgi:hypothetical protein